MVEFVYELLVIVSCPVNDPTVVPSNVTVIVALCPGFRVSGSAIGDNENPVPVTAIDVTVTADVPVELKVNVWAEGVFTPTEPNPMLVPFTASTAAAAFS